MKKLCLIIAVLLAGCGSGSGKVDMPPAPAGPQVDEFFALVGAVVAANSEESDANDVALVTPTTPDASDPETM